MFSLITYLNNASQKDNPVALTVGSDLAVINVSAIYNFDIKDKMNDLSSLRSCVSPLPSLMQSGNCIVIK